MLNCENDTVDCLSKNKPKILSELSENVITTVYKDDSKRVNLIKNKNKSVTVTCLYGDKQIASLFKEMIDLKLF